MCLKLLNAQSFHFICFFSFPKAGHTWIEIFDLCMGRLVVQKWIYWSTSVQPASWIFFTRSVSSGIAKGTCWSVYCWRGSFLAVGTQHVWIGWGGDTSFLCVFCFFCLFFFFFIQSPLVGKRKTIFGLLRVTYPLPLRCRKGPWSGTSPT